MPRTYNRKPPAPPATRPARSIIASTCRGLDGQIPSYHWDAKGTRRTNHFSRSDRVDESPYPWGSRIVLFSDAPSAERYKTALVTIQWPSCGLDTPSHALALCDEDGIKRPISQLTAARWPRFFDLAEQPDLVLKITQPSAMRQVTRYLSGLDFETVCEALETEYLDRIHGGRSGESSFDLLWKRDIQGYLNRHSASTVFPKGRLKRYAKRVGIRGKRHEIIAHLFTRVIELERACEYVEGYLKRRTDDNWRSSGADLADLSPLSILSAVYRADQLAPGEPSDHAERSMAILDSLRLRQQGVREDESYEQCLGTDELGYLIRVLLSMLAETPRDRALSRGRASSVFRFALNMLAGISHTRTGHHMNRRLRGEKHEELRIEIEQMGPPSVFAEMSRGMPTWNEFVADDGLTFFGTDLVLRLRGAEEAMVEAGIRDPDRNPLIRAGYCPDAWTSDVGSEAMIDAWICINNELRTLDLNYASPWFKGKEMKDARNRALILSETPIPPMTDFVFANDLEFPCLSAGRLIGIDDDLKKFHFGQKSQIRGLPASKKCLNSNVFGARPYFESLRNH
ncbi:hypothetical protein [Croceicoccus marinus]|uniref:Uncharacterized protein n=1 Tax=Croceicoccus marinus TaxID=450378 RepID=A0A7G6VTL9_9SPHN|nr:hypothetical protein [Croceicoccus marinus]QNE05084.1 hypothetical protein H4O24_14500 [Croceicoccus marinus]